MTVVSEMWIVAWRCLDRPGMYKYLKFLLSVLVREYQKGQGSVTW